MAESVRDEHFNDNGLHDGDFEEEPDFSDSEDYVDDISDSELLEDILRTKPKEFDGLENVIVVDRVPQVGPDRLEKLKTVITKLFSKVGDIVGENYPLDSAGLTQGYIFIEYKSHESAVEAVKQFDGHRLDKTHVFAVNIFTDIEKYSSIPDEFEPPQPKEYVDRGNLKEWLSNSDAFDHYSVLHDGGLKTAVFMNSNPEPSLVQERPNWTETIVSWSPLGTYLATFHKKGIALWGGPKFTQLHRFAHDGVSFIDFSPCENYLVTFSGSLAGFDDPNAFIIWDIRTEAKRRAFHADRSSIVWPVFKWSHDDKYFGRVTQDTLSVYETPSMMLVDKKSIKIAGVRNFAWSPTQNLLAYWVAEDKDVPARVSLLEIPSRKELRAKNLFNVSDCRMHWQKNGDYLCVKVDRYAKLKKIEAESKPIFSGIYYNFEVFLMREKQIPVDSIEIKESIQAFGWEPNGNKFAIIHGDGPQTYTLSFYGIKQGSTFTLIKKLENKQCNHIFWSPAGQYMVLASLKSVHHTLEFIDTSDFSVTNTTEHFMASDLEWDPTGRYVVTGNSYWAHRVDNSFWFWTFQGKLIRKVNMEGFCQMLWRPRPASLLPDDKIKEIKRNLKKYSPQFEMRDRMAQSKVSEEILANRRKLLSDYETYREEKKREWEETLETRAKMRKIANETQSDNDVEEETIEFFTKEETFPVVREE
ncbi:Eukaryotic translation initiation factor 3 subunit B [Halotydeus destructor]|nr:Eukaryotic translation initiation factor 3 subunit B [Halotydeus destructor]